MKFLWSCSAFLFAVLFLMACKHHDKNPGKNDFDHLYFDYTVAAEEGAPYVTCLLQFKENSLQGVSVNVEPGKVELDGQQLQGDSAGLSGFYYEIQKPMDSFAGKHTIVFTSSNDKQFHQKFEFIPFSLTEELPAKIYRKPFALQLKNFPDTPTPVRLLLLDTAFVSKGFNDTIHVVNGQINIDQSILNNLKKGPIILELYMEQEIPLDEHTKAGGRLSLTYGLKREFELAD